ncbi:Gfo/Idh/MocA family protein [Planctomicrobium sp. SH661]|uniref:Gfo/Idh/MocA family protein n=1 Tax=Planctomicrobium sp. SH661 TaxID=3448124 RepID=UPI003F5C188D
MASADSLRADDEQPVIKLGIIGVDTSHAIHFTRMFNDSTAADHVPGCRVVATYPYGSTEIPSSSSRIPGNTKELEKYGVQAVASIEELLPLVDAVLLETNDGNPRLQQARLVIQAGKPMFIDKPVAASLADTGMILQEAQAANVPVFSTSSCRFMEGAKAAREGALGKIYGCDTYGPESREPSHPTLFWYGIHGVEALFTVMGPGCESVTRVETETSDVVVGRWRDGRIGTFRGLYSLPQDGPKIDFGGTAFGSKGIAGVGPFKGYQPLVKSIHEFLSNGTTPVELRETLEIYAFMVAADESSRQGGKSIRIDDTLKAAGLDPQLFLKDAASPPAP